jgi:hypothetical protein
LKNKIFVSLFFVFYFLSNRIFSQSLSVTREGVSFELNSAKISSPTEGLWSISTDWNGDWPDSWIHANPEKIEEIGPWKIASGTIETKEGNWDVSDAYKLQNGYVKVIRRFIWRGEKTTYKNTLSSKWMVIGDSTQVVMPGVLYNGNPSGRKTGYGLVPFYDGRPGEELIVEEHRYPMPFVSVEFCEDKIFGGAAVHSLPSPVPYGNKDDQWWSFGVIGHKGKTEIILLSGPVAMNGERSVVKANQEKLYPYSEAWVNVPPGGIIEKTFYLQAYPVASEGSGFTNAMSTSLDIFSPSVSNDLPSGKEIVSDKYRFAMSRWLTTPHAFGFSNFDPNHKKKEIAMGWVGQAAVPGYALPVLQKQLNDPDIIHKVQASMDFLSNSPFNKEGFAVVYDYAQNIWSRSDLLAQGQGMNNFASAIIVGRENISLNTFKWEAFLKKACKFHSNRILNDDWYPVSTNEAYLIAPLFKAASIFDNKDFARAAEKASLHYANRHLSLKEPYWGGTLDARAEDKEGAWAAFQAFLAGYEYTKNQEYLSYAKHACDLMLTYTFVWDVMMPRGRMADHSFKTRGWTSVSVQNHHLDVYGVLTAPSVYRLGEYLNDSRYQDLAKLMYRSCGQIIDPFGSQGEQVQQTNYLQRGRGKVETLDYVRGGYFEDWTVFWITSHFLSGAAQFYEMGVDLD